MIECIKNLNLEGPMNKKDLFNLFKTKSTHINSMISSKIEIFSKISDFFIQLTNIDIYSISKSIDYLKKIFLNLSFPNSNDEKDIDHYLKILSIYIITIHYNLKIKNILENKIKDFQQHFLEEIMNNKLKDEYKDKIIEFNSLSYSIFSTSLPIENSFSSFLYKTNINKDNYKYVHKKEDHTPKFCTLDIESKSQFNKNKENEKKDNKIENKTKMNNKSSYSLVSMSSILVNNKNQDQTKKNLHYSDKTKIKKYGNEEKNNNKISTKDNIFDNKILHIKEKQNINKNNFIKEKLNRKQSLNTVCDLNNIGNKELFIEFLKFANGIYKDKYIDENQKKLLKQLIIIYMESKNSHSNQK